MALTSFYVILLMRSSFHYFVIPGMTYDLLRNAGNEVWYGHLLKFLHFLFTGLSMVGQNL